MSVYALSNNEVYFDNVRIPDAQRLGEVGDGWRVSLTTLMNERMAVGGAIPTGIVDFIDLVRGLVLDSEKAIDRADVKAIGNSASSEPTASLESVCREILAD